MSTVKWNIFGLHLWTVILDYSLSLLIVPYMIYPALGGIPLGLLQLSGVPPAIQFYMATAELGRKLFLISENHPLTFQL